MVKQIRELIEGVLAKKGIEVPDFVVEHPTELSHGDYSTNVALVAAKSLGKNPRELATELVESVQGQLSQVKGGNIDKVDVAGPGFINFHLADKFFSNSITEIIEAGEDFGKGQGLAGKKVIVEYTDPNPFKEFHIGHVMSNAIGESLARLQQASGAEVLRVNYQGDVGMHVAKAIWGMKQSVDATPLADAPAIEHAKYMGMAYARGAEAYETDDAAKKRIEELNKHIYTRDDDVINMLYDKGRAWSLEYFETIYEILGTKFDHYFFESEVGKDGVEIVKANPEIFPESDGARVFKGEDHGLHTRVFINSKGLPTYEAKELGLNKDKNERFHPDMSLIVTGNEITDYFKVVKKAMELVLPEVEKITTHVPHGMLRLPEGKMSSRTGKVITAMSLIEDVKQSALKKMGDEKNIETATAVAVAAIKYSILKQAPGKDAIFDLEQALSFEGDSGPYIQYTHARALSVLEKGKTEGLTPTVHLGVELPSELEKLLYRFPEVVASARSELAPQQVVHYLIQIASAYNSFYGQNIIIDEEHKEQSAHRLALSQAVVHVLKTGLWVLGIKAPERM